MLVYCWSTVSDAGQALSQHWANVTCFLGRSRFGNIDSPNVGIVFPFMYTEKATPSESSSIISSVPAARALNKQYQRERRMAASVNMQIKTFKSNLLKVIYHPLYGMNNYVLIWGD